MRGKHKICQLKYYKIVMYKDLKKYTSENSCIFIYIICIYIYLIIMPNIFVGQTPRQTSKLDLTGSDNSN